MILNDYLKSSREKSGLSQEEAASRLNVSVATIQSWEINGFPDKCYWADIINCYGLDQSVFQNLIFTEVLKFSGEESTYCEFPDMLFTETENLELQNLTFTEKEFELYALVYFYKKLEKLPYEYIKEEGVFETVARYKDLIKRIGRYRKFIDQYSCEHPGEIFNIYRLTPDEYVSLKIFCNQNTQNYSIKPFIFKNEKEFIERYNQLKELAAKPNGEELVSYTKEMGNYRDPCVVKVKDITITDRFTKQKSVESDDEEYLRRKAEYVELLEVYNRHPDFYGRKPEPPKELTKVYHVVTDEGYRFMEWVERYL